ncbi:MAG: 6-phosphofructokinase [Bacillota bacterium]|nr:6-phosphofructokinase [Bacillota bacterium]
MIKKIAVLTSGGDAPGMNAAIRAVVRQGINKGCRICGIQRGYAGFFDKNKFVDFDMASVADIIHRGGTILLTARSPEMHQPEFQDRAAARLLEEGIEGLVVIGGEGSFRGAQTLAERGIKVICIPGTIDNDINGTELTIGFDTAVNTILDAINRLRDTATSHERIFIVEVMGRRTGYLALAAGLAGGAESILVPEVNYTLDTVCSRLLRGIENQKSHSIIVVAEGAANVFELNKKISQKINMETRVTVLGHIQRGGSPSAVDRLFGSRMGAAAIDLLKEGKSGLFTAVKNEEIVAMPLGKSLEGNKPFPAGLHQLALDLSR